MTGNPSDRPEEVPSDAIDLNGEGDAGDMMPERFAVPYYRVSTDDKDQRPERQALIVRPWGEREGIALLKAEVDEGTSASKTPALKREKFLVACERAAAAGAEAVVMEKADRFSRQDPVTAIWEMVEVEKRYGVKLYFASHGLDFQQTPIGRIVVFMELAMGHQYATDLSSRVRSGMALRGAGTAASPFGRKPKGLRDGEEEMIAAWLEEGKGWPTVSILLNEARGVHRMSPDAKKRAFMSESTLKRLWRRRSAGQNGSSVETQVKSAGDIKGATP